MGMNTWILYGFRIEENYRSGLKGAAGNNVFLYNADDRYNMKSPYVWFFSYIENEIDF